MNRHGPQAASKLFALIDEADMEVEAVTPPHARLVIGAFARYGKGRHKAVLYYGDCIAYALTKAAGLPLLFKGNDFTHTDLSRAVYSPAYLTPTPPEHRIPSTITSFETNVIFCEIA